MLASLQGKVTALVENHRDTIDHAKVALHNAAASLATSKSWDYVVTFKGAKDKDKMKEDTLLGNAILTLTHGDDGPTTEHTLDIWRTDTRKRGQVFVQASTAATRTTGPHALLPFPSTTGPARFSRHTSYAAGVLTGDKQFEFYTYRVRLYHIAEIFGPVNAPRHYQHWNTEYDAAKRIFAETLEGTNLRNMLHSQHSYLYRHDKSTLYGALFTGRDLVKLLHGKRLEEHREKEERCRLQAQKKNEESQRRQQQQQQQQQGQPSLDSHTTSANSNVSQNSNCTFNSNSGTTSNTSNTSNSVSTSHPEHDLRMIVFTYTILAKGLYFSETGTAFFRDFMSKHAMHGNRATDVVYAGEFRLFRDHGKKNNYNAAANYTVDDMTMSTDHGPWTLLIDNNSGTYAPRKQDLPLVRKLFQANFPDLIVDARDHDDPMLKEIREATKKTLENQAAKQGGFQSWALFSNMSSKNEDTQLEI
ncbi:hypothetical protein BGZ94_006528 [Podila epigama]|nr:hypothetical protein BGZ94_006528 [Podila epigama]